MKIKVISFELTQKDKYSVAEVTYRSLDREGKVSSKKVMSFNKVYETASKVQKDEVYDITSEKDKNDYWVWTAMVKSDEKDVQTVSASGSNFRVAKSTNTYETPEERALKEVRLARKNGLNVAVEYLKATKGAKFNVDEVITVAERFADFAIAGTTLADMVSDEVS